MTTTRLEQGLAEAMALSATPDAPVPTSPVWKALVWQRFGGQARAVARRLPTEGQLCHMGLMLRGDCDVCAEIASTLARLLEEQAA